jgi:hypothetical protein
VFANASPLSARVVPFIDDRGAEVVVVLAKATFRRRGADLALAGEQARVRLVDVPTDPRAEAEGRGSPSALRIARKETLVYRASTWPVAAGP